MSFADRRLRGISLLVSIVSLLSSCKTVEKPNSSPFVTGGREDYLILPQSVGIGVIHDGEPGKAPHCTGGFITDRLLLTAAHCTNGKDPAFVVSEHPAFKGKLVTSKLLYSNPDYAARSKLQPAVDVTSTDIGFIIFPEGTAPPEMIMKIAPASPKVGDPVQLVGWGLNNQPDYETVEGKRHHGKSKVAKVDAALDDKITLVGITFTDKDPKDNEMVSAGPGDSGGPLFNDKGEVIGVTSNIGSVDQNFFDANKKTLNTTSNYANLNNPVTRKIVDKIVAQYSKGEAKAATPTASYLPQCKKDNLSAGDIKLVFEAGKGFMRLKSGGGFSCKINAETNKDLYYPSCAIACKDQAQKEKDWGWCSRTEGFACKE